MWPKGINGWSFRKGTSWADAAAKAKAAGFDAIEPTFESEGELTPVSTEAECRRIGDGIRQSGLEIASLACGLLWETPYTSDDVLIRERAIELTRAALQRASWIRAPVLLVVPGLVSHPRNPTRRVTTYTEALRRANAALAELSNDAESCGVTIAVENVWNQFLVSPIEMCEFLDRINSPWVGAYLDVGNVLRYGFPQDWIDLLAGRLVRVHVKDFKIGQGDEGGFRAVGEGDVDWPAVMGALRRQNYVGPLIHEGGEDLADIARRLEEIESASSREAPVRDIDGR